MTAKNVLHRIIDQPCTNRIQVDVEDQSLEVPLAVDQPRLVPALPERPGSSPPPVERLGETSLERSHRPGQRHRRRPKRQGGK